ncbi:OmpA family protein [Verrucomicrobiales bacterium BCK34]|nr:OmpA family protein [Verrucomicrobiales bacterium BCK34]
MFSLSTPISCLVLASALIFTGTTKAQEGKTFTDNKGREIFLPQGELSFADRAVSYTDGEKIAAKEIHRDPGQALGLPDYTNPSSPGFLALGCDGSVVLQFTDNVLTDVEGTDLYVFEVGPDVEAAEVEISNNGTDWIPVGRIEGSRSEVDIAPYVEEGELFTFVKLTNASGDCSGRTPGADIDAVAAVGSGYRLSLNSEVLFDVAKWDLKDAARAELDQIAAKMDKIDAGFSVVVEGHTDSDGSAESNDTLSRNRAQSVLSYLETKSQNIAEARVFGYGESRPVAENDTDEGKAQNRRVDILILPAAAN